MAESRREGPQTAKEAERQTTGTGNGQRGSEAARQAERLVDVGREGVRQTTETTKAAAAGALRSGASLADGAQEITAAWTHYAEEVLRHTSEASQALLRARSFNEVLDVQSRLLRNNMQAFFDQTAKIAETASRMATRPLEALKGASAEQARR